MPRRRGRRTAASNSDVLQAQDDANKVLFVESWRDADALAVHSKVPRMEENRAVYTPGSTAAKRRAATCS